MVPGGARPLVFPGEARVGASAFMVIDSNQFQIGDQLERYDLHRDRVGIRVEGNQGSAYANVRSVFAIESGRATDDAELRPNAWMMVAFFDLPDESSEIFSAPYPHHAFLHLEIDDQEVPELESVIWIVGEGGEPTSMNAVPLLPLLENELEPQTMVRLRARSVGTGGFQSSWLIAGISVEVDFDPSCLSNPRAYVGSDAARSGITVGPPITAPWNTSRNAVQIVLTQPRGFQLASQGSVDPTRIGFGPILDIAFDRATTGGCSGALASYFSIHSLKVRDRDGTVRVSRPAASESFDASEFFQLHFVDPDHS